MAFEILSIHGETLPLTAAPLLNSLTFPGESALQPFADPDGHRYSATFNGSHVTFSDGAQDFIGEWSLGSSATVIKNSEGPLQGFIFTFMDHGPRPQTLHAVWSFPDSLEHAIAAWESAGFSLSPIDRYINRNHPRAMHLRTKGAFATGAGSSHVVIPLRQPPHQTSGDIHVGEFNPLTGCGIGFVLHQCERWMAKPRLRQAPSSRLHRRIIHSVTRDSTVLHFYIPER